MKTISLAFVLLSVQLFITQSSFAVPSVGCSSDEYNTLSTAHDTARNYVIKAHQILTAGNSPLIAEGFKKYFNLDYYTGNQTQVKNVKEMMNRLYSNVDRVSYRCAKDYRPLCQPGILAIVPLPARVNVCPSYFNRDFEKQVGTLIHEWGHRWGSFRYGQFRLKWIAEKYCTETAGASPSVLIHQPDSYMLFTYFLATDGKGIRCF